MNLKHFLKALPFKWHPLRIANRPYWRRLLLKRFLRHLESKNSSPETVKWYEHKWRIFLEWLDANNIWHITPEVIQDFLDHVRHERKASAETVQGYYRALNAGFNWACGPHIGILQLNPMDGLSRPKTPKTVIEIFKKEEIEAILGFIQNRPGSSQQTRLRDYAIVTFFYATGVRESELLKLKWSDIDLDLRRATVWGKGAKQRVVQFGKFTGLLLELLHKTRTDGAVFANQKGGHLSKSHVYDMFQESCDGAGVPRRKVHALRHTYACTYLDNGGDGGDLMALMGLSSMYMVNHYSQWTRAQRALRKAEHIILEDSLSFAVEFAV